MVTSAFQTNDESPLRYTAMWWVLAASLVALAAAGALLPGCGQITMESAR
jgi:hypothetical protein